MDTNVAEEIAIGSCEEVTQLPLSPILNSSAKSIRKIRKNKKPKSKCILSSEPENVFQQLDAHINEKCNPVHEVTVLNKEEDLINRIKALEQLEEHKESLTQRISSSSKIPIHIVKVTEYENNPNKISLNILPQQNIRHLEVNNVNLPRKDNIGFQTGSGEKIDLPRDKVQEHSKLFEDILHGRDITKRNPKFGFLRKCNKSVKSELPHNNDKHFKNDETKLKSLKTASRNLFQVSKDETFSDIKILKESNFEAVCKVPNVDRPTLKNIFQGESFDDLQVNNFGGFKSASACITEAETLFDDDNISKPTENKISKFVNKPEEINKVRQIFQGENFDDLKLNNFEGFKSANSMLESTEVYLQNYKINNMERVNSKNVFKGENFDDLFINTIPGLAVTSSRLKQAEVGSIFNGESSGDQNFPGTSRNITEMSKFTNIPASTNKIKSIFQCENFDDLKSSNFEGFKTASSTKPKPTGNVSKLGFRNIFDGENFDDLNLNAIKIGGFTPASKNRLLNVENSFVSPCMKDNKQKDFSGFFSTEQKTTKSLSKSYCDLISLLKKRYLEIRDNVIPSIVVKDLENCSKTIQEKASMLLPKFSIKNQSVKQVRKRKLSESDHISMYPKLEHTPNSSFKKTKRLGCHFSPTIHIKQLDYSKAQNLFHDIFPTSTPVKHNAETAPITLMACDLTPIQINKTIYRREDSISGTFRTVLSDKTLVNHSCNITRFNLNKPSNSNLNEWIANLQSEQRILEERIRINKEKQKILENQRNILVQSSSVSAWSSYQMKTGVLYNSKIKHKKQSLKDFVGNAWTERGELDLLNQVNPQNAHLFHFTLGDKRVSHVDTQDGAILIPNVDNRIGITEIEHSFKLIDGVDPNLVPKGWIRNHFKWIVWKLASYERMFPQKFDGCLNIENIVQQLKYRYDLEIDRVKRPALRKIFEKDDSSQRTMVLCVSKIIKNNQTDELELTDGWYSVRTVIDKPLSEQITKGRIRLGVKLATSGAELFNCDGCFPLEAPESAYLKINYNSTRRAVWWSKLGYQKDVRPLLVPLSSVDLEGGKIGYIRCYIFRRYPVVYMEKTDKGNVWRNKKAEEYYLNSFESNKMKELERMTSKLESETRRDKLRMENNNKCSTNLRDIDDPEVLYEVCKNWEPEDLQELSANQKDLLNKYMAEKMFKEQDKILKQVMANNKKLPQRTVTSLLKVKVLDASGKANRPYDFHIWNPQEGHFQELKEGEIVSIFNVSTSTKWGLTANQNTRFKKEPKSQSNIYDIFKRTITPIQDLKFFNSKFKEFDTIGLPVKRTSTNKHQELWITDHNENLLLIKLFNTPDRVLLLDKMEESRPVTLCNLHFKESFADYTLAVADQRSTCTKYPESKIIQSKMNEFEHLLKNKDLRALLEGCKVRIEKLCRPMMGEMEEMDCSQMTATDIALLQCVDKLI